MEFSFEPPAPTRTINLEADGLAPGDLIDGYLEERWQGGWKVVVPEGRYRLADPTVLELATADDAWLVGEGPVVLEHGVLDNPQFNFTAEGTAHLRVQNITLEGVAVGNDSKMRAWAPDDGLVELVNVNRPGGTENLEDATGCYVPPSHAGTVRFIDCHFAGFSDNGVYASSPGYDRGEDGPVEFYGGLYRNCNVSAIRVGSTNSKVVGPVVINDATAPTQRDRPSGVQRGIRVRAPGDGILIRECDVTHTDVPGVSRPIAIENGNSEFPADEGSTRVEGTRIRNETSHAPISMREPDAGYEVTGTDLQLSGGGSLEPDGGPYDGVTAGDAAVAPRTKRRWVYDGPYAVQDAAISSDDN